MCDSVILMCFIGTDCNVFLNLQDTLRLCIYIIAKTQKKYRKFCSDWSQCKRWQCKWAQIWMLEIYQKINAREFPGGPGVRTQHFHCCGPRFDPWSGNWDSASCTARPKKKRYMLNNPSALYQSDSKSWGDSPEHFYLKLKIYLLKYVY